MCCDGAFWFLRPGLILPSAAIVAALRLEDAGHQLLLDEDAVRVRWRGGKPDPALLSEARRWKHHIWLFVHHCAHYSPDIASIGRGDDPPIDQHQRP
jgi:hypothetical protein